MQNTYTKEKESENIGKDSLSDYASTAMRQGEEKIKNIVADAEKKIKQGEEQLRHLATNVDKKLHENPWPIVAGVAAGCLLVGFLVGTTRRN